MGLPPDRCACTESDARRRRLRCGNRHRACAPLRAPLRRGNPIALHARTARPGAHDGAQPTGSPQSQSDRASVVGLDHASAKRTADHDHGGGLEGWPDTCDPPHAHAGSSRLRLTGSRYRCRGSLHGTGIRGTGRHPRAVRPAVRVRRPPGALLYGFRPSRRLPPVQCARATGARGMRTGGTEVGRVGCRLVRHDWSRGYVPGSAANGVNTGYRATSPLRRGRWRRRPAGTRGGQLSRSRL